MLRIDFRFKRLRLVIEFHNAGYVASESARLARKSQHAAARRIGKPPHRDKHVAAPLAQRHLFESVYPMIHDVFGMAKGAVHAAAFST
jgi:hypothetical protein